MASDPDKANSPESASEPDLLKRLEADDELRRDWVVNPAEHRWAVGVCAFMGGWGVVCGWIVFLKVYGETQPQSPKQSDLQTFVIALFVAACVGFLAEYMQEIIDRGRRDAGEEGEPPPTRLRGLMRMAPRMVFAVIVIALFDLYSDAWNDFVKNYNKEELLKTFRDILLPPLAGVDKNVFVDFAAIALLWIVVGAILGAVISHLVIKRTGRHRGQVATGLKAGLLAGCVAAPLGVLAYVLLTRAALGVYMMVWEHGRWDRHVDALVHNYNWAALPVMLLDRLGHAPYRLAGLPVVGPVLILAFAGWLIVWSARRRNWTAVQLLLLSVGVIFAAPLLEDFGNVALLLAFTALVWGVPASVLGMSMPYLKRPSRRPRVWGLVALGSATLLVGLTSLRLAEKGFYYAAVLLLVAGFFLLRSRRVEDYWPLLALCVAMVICEAMILMQRVTFFGVLERVHAVNSLPPDVHKKASRDLVALDFYEQMKKYMPPVPEEGAAVRNIRARMEGLKNLPTAEAQLEEVTRKLPEEIEREKLAAAVGAWRGTSWRPAIATPASNTGRNLSNCDASLADRIDEPHAATLEEELKRTDELKGEAERLFASLPASLPPAPPRWVGVPGGSFLPGAAVQPAASPDGQTSEGDAGAIDGDYWRFYCPAFKPEYLCSGESPSPHERLCAYGRARESLRQKRELLEALLVRGEYPESRSVIDLNRYALNDASFQIRKLDEIKKSLTEGLSEKVRALEEKKRWEENRVAQKLELSLTGSLGFWVTIGLLAGWAIVENQRLVERGRGGVGPARCFWAAGGLLDYHDRVHGVAPADDRELFRRLSLDILAGDARRERRDFFDELFGGFVPERVASMSVEELQKKYEELKYTPEREALGASLPGGVPMVIENAKRLVEFYGARDGSPDSSAQTLLREWRLRADTDPAGLVSHVRSFFRVPAAMPVGTFLQSVGLIPGAHFEGCEFARGAGARG